MSAGLAAPANPDDSCHSSLAFGQPCQDSARSPRGSGGCCKDSLVLPAIHVWSKGHLPIVGVVGNSLLNILSGYLGSLKVQASGRSTFHMVLHTLSELSMCFIGVNH